MSVLSPALKSGVTPMTGFMSPNWFRCRAVHRRWAIHWNVVARCRFAVGGNAQKAHRTITGEVLRRDDIGPVHAGHPDALGGLFAAAGEGIGQAPDNAPA